MKYPIDLVLKVNEIYHDVEGEKYEKKHPEIFILESDRWKKIAQQFVIFKKNIKVLDIGSGTGFVPLQIASFLKKEDLFVCSDLSAKLLNVSKKNLSKSKFKCKFEFLKLTGKDIKTNHSFNFITLNSVLHHIPNLNYFFKEINSLLNVGGLLIIGHEPNNLFYKNDTLWNRYKLLSILFNPKSFFLNILKKSGLYELIRKILNPFVKDIHQHDNIIKGVNKRLIKEKIVDKPLSVNEVNEIVDIHSPTAGVFDKNKGFDVYCILKNYLPNFKIKIFKTYNHLRDLSFKNSFLRKYDLRLKKKYPESGATFMVVFEKIKN